jgi:hypothetical protein
LSCVTRRLTGVAAGVSGSREKAILPGSNPFNNFRAGLKSGQAEKRGLMIRTEDRVSQLQL